MTGGGYDLLPRESANLTEDVIRERRSRGFSNGAKRPCRRLSSRDGIAAGGHT